MITDMVKAHLENVKSLISDLENQKINIQKEIDKLQAYLEKGTNELTVFENTNTVTKTNYNKHYLGEWNEI